MIYFLNMNQIIIIFAAYLIYVAALYSAIHVFWKHDRKHFIRDAAFLLGTATVSWVISHFLKGVIAHPRPDAALALIVPDDTYSFPSGHASFMFALAFAMNHFSWRAGFILVLLATLTGLARVAAGVHYPLDIIGGAILGYFVSCVAIFFYKKYFHKNR